ncbi:MAG: hypothetical protein HY747_04890 [Elusimicrobia bacterium]|nr:hypothetical protein [Elusimicrobiota bacterium]
MYEAALGLVDPALKSRGLFAKIFKKTMSIAGETPMHYLYFDFVTNHILSQKLISRYGTCDMALFLGCQTKEHQASLEKIGLGPDPEDMDRYTILFSIIPRVKQPFGKKICLPESLGSRLGFLLKPLGLTWYPASRIDTLTPEGGYKTEVQTAQKAVIFDMYQPGRQAAEKILDEWREYLNDGYEYAAVDVPLGGPGIGALYDLLSRNGFFVSGFIPYRFTERLGFRFQSLGHTKVAFDKIQIATASGKRLLETIVQEQTILT